MVIRVQPYWHSAWRNLPSGMVHVCGAGHNNGQPAEGIVQNKDLPQPDLTPHEALYTYLLLFLQPHLKMVVVVFGAKQRANGVLPADRSVTYQPPPRACKVEGRATVGVVMADRGDSSNIRLRNGASD